jgi:hypothetical protein
LTAGGGFTLIQYRAKKSGCIKKHDCCTSDASFKGQCCENIFLNGNVITIFNVCLKLGIGKGEVGVQLFLTSLGLPKNPLSNLDAKFLILMVDESNVLLR